MLVKVLAIPWRMLSLNMVHFRYGVFSLPFRLCVSVVVVAWQQTLGVAACAVCGCIVIFFSHSLFLRAPKKGQRERPKEKRTSQRYHSVKLIAFLAVVGWGWNSFYCVPYPACTYAALLPWSAGGFCNTFLCGIWANFVPAFQCAVLFSRHRYVTHDSL